MTEGIDKEACVSLACVPRVPRRLQGSRARRRRREGSRQPAAAGPRVDFCEGRRGSVVPPNHHRRWDRRRREDAVRRAAILWGKRRCRTFEMQLSASSPECRLSLCQSDPTNRTSLPAGPQKEGRPHPLRRATGRDKDEARPASPALRPTSPFGPFPPAIGPPNGSPRGPLAPAPPRPLRGGSRWKGC